MKTYMNTFLITSILFFVLIDTGFIYGQKTIDITYLGNEGFLISGGNKKVIIDGIFSEGWGKYHIPSEQTLIQQRKALFPFDNLSVILISHNHADHINADYIIEHMMNDNKSVVICPLQVNTLLAPLKDYNAIKNNIITITPRFITKIDTTVSKLNFKIMLLQHANDEKHKIENLGFIVSVNGFNIFHPGDASFNSLNAFKSLNLDNDSIDIAFFPRWVFDSEYKENGNDIINYLNPKAIIMMHVNANKFLYYENAIKDMKGIPNIYFMKIQMEKLQFEKKNKSIITTFEKK